MKFHISKNYDYSISFFSTFNTGYKLWKSNIKQRYAPATKLAQIFYNKKIKQNRSLSIKSEYEYNNDLAKFFLKDNSYKILSSNNYCISLKKDVEISNKKKKLVFIHPFTGGSSKTLSCNDFIDLCKELNKLKDCSFILHCDSHDHPKCLELEKLAQDLDIKTISPTRDLCKMFHNIKILNNPKYSKIVKINIKKIQNELESFNKNTYACFPSRYCRLIIWRRNKI